jgi:hypothetical protein
MLLAIYYHYKQKSPCHLSAPIRLQSQRFDRQAMKTRRQRTLGKPTRGKTALNRLRQVDVYVALTLAHSLTSGVPLVVDIGFGAFPWTTLEMRERWLALNPALHVLGVEIDPDRVAAALPFAQPPEINFRRGGFNLGDVLEGQSVRLIRCYNVLRQYDESAVQPALNELAGALEQGGYVIEGTSTPSGGRVVFDVYQRVGNVLTHRALVFGSNFGAPHLPVDFQAILPKRLIHHMRDDRPRIFFQAWQESLALAKAQGATGSQQWMGAAVLLKERFGFRVDTRPRLTRRGYLTLYDTIQE